MRSSVSNSRHPNNFSIGQSGKLWYISDFIFLACANCFEFLLHSGWDRCKSRRLLWSMSALAHRGTRLNEQGPSDSFSSVSLYLKRHSREKSTSKLENQSAFLLTRLNEQVRDSHDFSSFTQFTCWSKHALLEFWKKISRPTHIPNTHTYIDRSLTCTFPQFPFELELWTTFSWTLMWGLEDGQMFDIHLVLLSTSLSSNNFYLQISTTHNNTYICKFIF